LQKENRKDISFIRGNVHISKHITKKLKKQTEYMKELGMEDHKFNFSEGVFPDMGHMPEDERKWFQEYQKTHMEVKEKIASKDYSILTHIGLSDDIPGALCVIASLKPGVHEHGQALLTEKFGIPLTGGKSPSDVKIFDEHKIGYQVVEKVVAQAIDNCRKNLGKRVEEHGFMEVAKFIDILIALYVPMDRIKYLFKFETKGIKTHKDVSFNVDQLK